MSHRNTNFPHLPDSLREWLSRGNTNQDVRVTPQWGGMINTAARLEMSRGAVFFAKWKENAPKGFFAAEANGLERLRAARIILTPGVYAAVDLEEAGQTSFLVLNYIETLPPSDPAQFARQFGKLLARLHRKTIAQDGMCGLEADNYIGVVPQINAPCARWPDFYRECRLLPQIELARQNGHLPEQREHLLMTVVERLDELLKDMDEPPCLLHGDLWRENLLCANDEPILIDPAVYYGPREMEIAYMELFNGFAPDVLEAYRAAYPLDRSYERRRPLHQLYPLLNHLNHFGETYGPKVDRVCRELTNGQG